MDSAPRELRAVITSVIKDDIGRGSPARRCGSFKNAGISLIFYDERIIRCQITPETVRRVIGTPFPDPLTGIELDDDEADSDDPSVEVFAREMREILGSKGE
jgi:uncharacterized protein YbcI